MLAPIWLGVFYSILCGLSYKAHYCVVSTHLIDFQVKHPFKISIVVMRRVGTWKDSCCFLVPISVSLWIVGCFSNCYYRLTYQHAIVVIFYSAISSSCLYHSYMSIAPIDCHCLHFISAQLPPIYWNRAIWKLL